MDSRSLRNKGIKKNFSVWEKVRIFALGLHPQKRGCKCYGI